ncbi:ABC transporter ATP-binding protein [Comamonas terrigena]|uniref:ABC transporter ATP-binding protein n=1 Tax=Comamonas terrigena TaxID=32013 RepID=UPI00244AC846|nr:ABC transporter ATP-binding protein [Comamonas terrigena]MDH1703855.1 ABC transporter ATP-binding protein/permease [Comamonas terrigena]
MLKTLVQLLGDEVHLLRRYAWMAVAYGVLCGLTMAALAPLLAHGLRGDGRAAIGWLGALLLGVLLSWLARRTVEQAGVRVGVAVLQSGRHRLGQHLVSLPIGWYTPQNTARIGHVVTQGMMGIAQLPAHVFTPLISGAATALIVWLALLVWNPVLGLVAVIALPLLAGAFAWASSLSARANAAFQSDFAETSQRVVEFAQAQSVLRAFSGEGSSTRFLEQALSAQRRSGLRLMVLSSLSSVFCVWAVYLVFAALWVAAVYGLHAAAGGALQAEELIAFTVSLLLVVRWIEPVQEIAGYAEVLRSAGAQLQAVRELLAAQPLPQPAQAVQAGDASVELRHVRFQYPGGADDVLRGVNLRAEPGRMTALIGASGSGKSTVMRLIARFFDTTQGVVLIGGVDVRDMGDAQLAAQISQIFQDSHLLSGSIADNILIGKPDASAAQVLQAARQAGLDEVIARLPQGLQTLVGENGARLSGGERQRIAIARALIKDAPILLVDEATAALDAENQSTIAQTLARLKGQRTLIVIAHQLSTVAMADQIVVLEDGAVVECGSPAQLQASPGRYARFLAQRQAAKGWRMDAAHLSGNAV